MATNANDENILKIPPACRGDELSFNAGGFVGGGDCVKIVYLYNMIMKTATLNKKTAKNLPKVKIGVSRQVAIPKKFYDAMRLEPGDYMEIELHDDRLTLTPKTFIEKRLAEGLRDIEAGKVIGPFKNAKEALDALGI
jgi:AbrB family looped-hinge helix DNA binding protein